MGCYISLIFELGGSGASGASCSWRFARDCEMFNTASSSSVGEEAAEVECERWGDSGLAGKRDERVGEMGEAGEGVSNIRKGKGGRRSRADTVNPDIETFRLAPEACSSLPMLFSEALPTAP